MGAVLSRPTSFGGLLFTHTLQVSQVVSSHGQRRRSAPLETQRFRQFRGTHSGGVRPMNLRASVRVKQDLSVNFIMNSAFPELLQVNRQEARPEFYSFNAM
jgi:hypothetical protein